MWISSFLLLSVAWASLSSAPLDSGAHCVAYRVKKTAFLFAQSTVLGRNCEVSAQVLPEVGGLYHIEVNVPVRSFSSGDPDRDKDVARILKADRRPDLTFKTKSLKVQEWRELFAKPSFEVQGQLTIGEKSHPVALTMRYLESESDPEVEGFGKVTFKDLGLMPPKVGGGLVVKAKEDIELYFRLQGRRILGADAIRLEKRIKK